MACTVTRQAALAARDAVTELLVDRLARAEVVGAVRRGRQQVPGLELLAICSDRAGLKEHLVALSFQEVIHVRELQERCFRFTLSDSGVQVALHLVDTIQAWPGMLIKTTGGERTVRRLEQSGRRNHLRVQWETSTIFKARGRGEAAQRYSSERGMFVALLGRYIRPEERE